MQKDDENELANLFDKKKNLKLAGQVFLKTDNFGNAKKVVKFLKIVKEIDVKYEEDEDVRVRSVNHQ